jgi:hypothetical protein
MASSKKDFTDFKNFPGSINKETMNYEFPLLERNGSTNKKRYWQIFVRLIKESSDFVDQDWNKLAENQVSIKKEYFKVANQSANDFIGQYWSESYVENGIIKSSAPTYIMNPKNLGRANERNVFQQALIGARSNYDKKIDSGFIESIDDESIDEPIDDELIVKPLMYYPMLATDYTKSEKYIKYPVYIQPKLNGLRCVIYLVKDELIAYTRNKKIYQSIDHIKQELLPYMKQLYNKESIYLDGEIYKHNKSLQKISGESRNEKVSKDLNEYHIYDCFYPSKLNMPFKERNGIIEELFKLIGENDYIKETPTLIVDNYEEAVKQYNKFIKKNYEGAMLRNIDSKYLASSSHTGANLRSKELVKLKPKHTEEFEIINYTQGKKGKDVGAIIWVCKTETGKEFNVTPKGITYQERYALFEECKNNFKKKYKGRMLSVEFQEKSDYGVPLRAKGINFRDGNI